MLDLFKNILFSIIAVVKMYTSYNGKKFNDRKLLSEMVRNVHSIEKGMCLPKSRAGYGLNKIKYLIKIVNEYLAKGYDKNRTELKMVCGALQSYVDFNKHAGILNDDIEKIDTFVNSFAKKIGVELDLRRYGGSIEISNNIEKDHEITLKDVILQRHSIRDFSDIPIEDDVILEAIELANHCPSACNRQSTHVYIVSKEKAIELEDWLDGIGGFANDINKFLIIAGRTSAFNAGEAYQYIVNAGIFTGYLSLCLNMKGIGNCVVQRPLLCSPTWLKFAKANDIPGDEQIVCMMALGISKEKYKVPISYRLSAEEIVRKL